MTEKQIEIRQLTPELLPDWLSFFDNEAFLDNPDWASCYCQFYHADHDEKDWGDRTGSENREASIRLIQRGRLRGHLAYLEGKVVGWCQSCPRTWVPILDANPDLRSDDAERVGSVLCFLVAPGFRGSGVAQALLDAACEGLSGVGMEVAEGYPRSSAKSDASNYHGPLSMYLSAGFGRYREFKDYLVVRRQLAPQPNRH
jgi:ribosomal protein S18 acetylase RimI-like enzyme